MWRTREVGGIDIIERQLQTKDQFRSDRAFTNRGWLVASERGGAASSSRGQKSHGRKKARGCAERNGRWLLRTTHSCDARCISTTGNKFISSFVRYLRPRRDAAVSPGGLQRGEGVNVDVTRVQHARIARRPARDSARSGELYREQNASRAGPLFFVYT